MIRRYFRILLSLSLGFLLLWLIMRGQNTTLIVEELRQANYLWIVPAMLFALLSHFLRAVRWNRLIRTMGYKTSAVQTFYAVMTGYLTNLAVPRMGEITRCITLSKTSGTPFNALAGTVVAERVFDFFTLVAIVFLTIILQFSFLKTFIARIFWDPLIEKTTENWLPLAIIAVVVTLLIIISVISLRKKLTDPKPGSFFHKIKRHFSGFLNGIKTIKRMRGKGWFILQTVLIWGLYYFTVYLCFFAITATSHLSPFVGFTLLAVGSLGILAPVPGGIGTYHFLTIITLTELYSIASEPATSYAYITHATQIIVNIIAGIFSWIMIFLQSRKSPKRET
jgi:glycosyltransferase 2 family protein